ncbi:hypothetical protein GQ53DRAFT_319316 [Thozetella sp. PMI_491]|nr:hypothetical protein GQ53DRAFT_319316 [Thozetella sp. PMI_491]
MKAFGFVVHYSQARCVPIAHDIELPFPATFPPCIHVPALLPALGGTRGELHHSHHCPSPGDRPTRGYRWFLFFFVSHLCLASCSSTRKTAASIPRNAFFSRPFGVGNARQSLSFFSVLRAREEPFQPSEPSNFQHSILDSYHADQKLGSHTCSETVSWLPRGENLGNETGIDEGIHYPLNRVFLFFLVSTGRATASWATRPRSRNRLFPLGP